MLLVKLSSFTNDITANQLPFRGSFDISRQKIGERLNTMGFCVSNYKLFDVNLRSANEYVVESLLSKLIVVLVRRF